MGQENELQVVDEEKVGQATPPWAAAFTTERDLVLEPVPHDLVQAPKADQPETLQSMGQRKVLQVVEEESTGHTTPPRATAVTIDRALVLEPVPQDLVQAP
jgi:hypothetical protein